MNESGSSQLFVYAQPKKVIIDCRSMLGLTSLSAAAFFELLAVFDELWQR